MIAFFFPPSFHFMILVLYKNDGGRSAGYEIYLFIYLLLRGCVRPGSIAYSPQDR